MQRLFRGAAFLCLMGGNLIGETGFRFESLEGLSLDALSLSVTHVARLEPGPIPFRVRLP